MGQWSERQTSISVGDGCNGRSGRTHAITNSVRPTVRPSDGRTHQVDGRIGAPTTYSGRYANTTDLYVRTSVARRTYVSYRTVRATNRSIVRFFRASVCSVRACVASVFARAGRRVPLACVRVYVAPARPRAQPPSVRRSVRSDQRASCDRSSEDAHRSSVRPAGTYIVRIGAFSEQTEPASIDIRSQLSLDLRPSLRRVRASACDCSFCVKTDGFRSVPVSSVVGPVRSVRSARSILAVGPCHPSVLSEKSKRAGICTIDSKPQTNIVFIYSFSVRARHTTTKTLSVSE